jgi:asparagine synthetase B (glutamine-hydrolysing)
MTALPTHSPAAPDLVFRAAREVVLVDGGAQFRELATQGQRRCFLHGSVLGEEPRALAEAGRASDAFGRFVLVLHDPERQTLTVQGDRHGLVPLYRASAGERLWLCTRIRPLVERGVVPGEPDWATLADLLAFRMALGAGTLVRGIECMEGGTSLEIDLDTLAVRTKRGWDPAALLREPGLPLAEVADELVARFLDATRRSLAGSEPAALTLSGGLDTRCLLAAALEAGRVPTAYHVGVAGSRAERYARRIAAAAGAPLRARLLDAGFPRRYLDLLQRVVDATDGMKFAPQPEMLWLRDEVAAPAVVLHGAFGELSKLRALRDFRLDAATDRARRPDLAGLLWQRFAPGFRANLRSFAPDARARLEEAPQQHLRALLEGFDRDLGVAEVLQLAYLREFVKAARYGHQIWNERVPTRFPFLEPRYVDLLLRVRAEDRLAPRVQHHLLERLSPALHALPDENTGTRIGASPLARRLVRLADQARIALFDSKVDANHGELAAWIRGMEPAPEELVTQWASDPLWDRAHLAGEVRVLRGAAGRPAPLRAVGRRRVQRAAETLQAFFVTELWRRSLAAARPGGRP